ncbi:hypothetical protein BVRB_7g165510 [Beta vulgaris subsp. vulgaris]|nr:hypothetical protein BVRB_7g165510 [Beta vulgaris subsp. vulgaris]
MVNHRVRSRGEHHAVEPPSQSSCRLARSQVNPHLSLCVSFLFLLEP